ncbi:MAG: DUF4199 domain-containing protein [Rikenellaceae bacterium]|nr:DUF4199 domain-containing protein [Rikenellaceae bacterium]
MDERELRRSFWPDALKGGIGIGLIWVICSLVALQIAPGLGRSLVSLLAFLFLGYFLFYFTRQRSSNYGSLGFSYGQGIGFIFAMMLFAGIIVFAGEFLAVNFVAPDHYEELGLAALENNSKYDPDSPEGEMMELIVGSPIFWGMVAAMRVVFLGGLIGLFTSSFVKRQPDIFADENI